MVVFQHVNTRIEELRARIKHLKYKLENTALQPMEKEVLLLEVREAELMLNDLIAEFYWLN